MSQQIRVLPDKLINQIAAGEVVQRPASVVKELIDNALDAGSNHIKIVIKEGGKQLIQIIDDGIGMDQTDASICFEKHATSKISNTEDLFHIQTMGFRGEALAAISSVAQLEMITCLRGAEVGTRIIIEGGAMKKQATTAAPSGTTISVKNLFYNIPARRNFLKSNSIEMKHIIEEFYRAALARTSVAFSLYHNGTEIYQLPVAKLNHRIIHIFGEGYKKQLIPCEETTSLLKITGYIGKPTYAKKTRGEQFFFVNKRLIKHNYLHHAIKSAFEGLLPRENFPFYVLFFEIAPDKIDVNVHPAKTEIKFEDERMVYAMLTAVVKKGLATHHIANALDFEANINCSPLNLSRPAAIPTFTNKATRNYMQFQANDNIAITTPREQPKLHLLAEKKETNAQLGRTNLKYDHAVPALQLYNTYILTQVTSGILLIDQNGAHERILYDKFIKQLANNQSGASQQLLMPVQVTLNPTDCLLVQEHQMSLHSLGFRVDLLGQDSIVITGLPVVVTTCAPQSLLEALIEQFKWNQAKYTLAVQENLARSLAKRASMPAGKKLTPIAINSLLAQFFSCTNMNYTPDGRKIFTLLSQKTLTGLLS